MQHARTPFSAMVAISITLGLFLLMYKLIDSDGFRSEPQPPLTAIKFGPVEIPDDPDRKIRTKIEDIDKPKPPPEMPVPTETSSNPVRPVVSIVPPLNPLPPGGNPTDLGVPGPGPRKDSGLGVRTAIPPIYPREQMVKGVKGWVLVEFSVTPMGTVRDARVIDAHPPRVFNQAALRAISRWMFHPKVVDGVPVQSRVTQLIEFNLND